LGTATVSIMGVNAADGFGLRAQAESVALSPAGESGFKKKAAPWGGQFRLVSAV